MRTRPIGGQDVLFEVNPLGGAAHIPEQTAPGDGVAIDLVRRDVNLLATLAILSEISQQSGFEKAAKGRNRERLDAEYGHKTIEAIAKGVIANKSAAQAEAKWRFARAFGMHEMVDGGLLNNNNAKAFTRGQYAQFLGTFNGPRGAVNREQFQRKLYKGLAILAQPVQRPKIQKAVKQDPPKIQPVAELIPSDTVLTIRERLLAIADDKRAGYYPTTHREKNTVLAHLDYMDNSQHLLGTNNQRLEIYNHQERLRKSTGQDVNGVRSITSITYELLDYLHDAQQQLNALLQLDFEIANMLNPNVSLREELPQGHAGIAFLVRYRDLDMYVKGTKGRVFADPLVTKEDRWAFGNSPGKHKLVHDRYTKPKDAAAHDKINSALDAVLIKDLRPLIKAALPDALARRAFLAARAAEVAKMPGGDTFKAPRQLAMLTIKTFGLEYTLDAAA